MPLLEQLFQILIKWIRQNPGKAVVIGGGAAAGGGYAIGRKVGKAKGKTQGKKEGMAEQAKRDASVMDEMHKKHDADRKKWSKQKDQYEQMLDEKIEKEC